MKRIFILDDNEELLEIMQRLLSQDYLVQCSAEPGDGVQAIMEFNPDLLLLDHAVGEMNSADILGKLKATQKFKAPVVLFSAHPMLKDLAVMMGANGHIDKPSDINYIRQYIKQILN